MRVAQRAGGVVALQLADQIQIIIQFSHLESRPLRIIRHMPEHEGAGARIQDAVGRVHARIAVARLADTARVDENSLKIGQRLPFTVTNWRQLMVIVPRSLHGQIGNVGMAVNEHCCAARRALGVQLLELPIQDLARLGVAPGHQIAGGDISHVVPFVA